ncbi:MAG: HAD-IA family hydrolase [Pseudomonadales bacterium]|nr:HAD-IA family hydrolase [Pseudomonadales bacterium]NRA17769.1 HAD-IA family hydrolase [Oceanospirillaceae bacterium]
MFKLLIFDWDGTLMDSSARIVSSMQSAASSLSLSIPTSEAVRNIIGLSLEQANKLLIPGISDNDNQQLCAAYSEHYRYRDQTPTPLYPGVQSTLLSLHDKGYLLAVATGKGRGGIERVFAETGLGPLFVTSRGADETKSKPDPLMLRQILQQTDIAAQQAIMIGDTSYDLEMAQRANMPSVAVSYGMHSLETLRRYKPILEVDKFQQIEPWLDRQMEMKCE